MEKKDPEIMAFASAEMWEQWLDRNYETFEGIWLKMFKKNSGIETVVYAEALDVALCYGWIDGQVKSMDEVSYIQKFTPRRPRSMWSRRNIENVARLESQGRMRPQGVKAVEEAKSDGRWENAYHGPREMPVPQDFMEELKKDTKALAFFEGLNKTNKYSITWRLATAKRPETRQRRMKVILEMLSKHQKF